MYYVCIPAKQGYQCKDFVGYTDNYFLYRKYSEFLMNFGYDLAYDIMDIEDGINCDNEDDLLNNLNSIIQSNILYDAALRKIQSDIYDDFIVIPDRIYEKFTEHMYTSTKPRRLVSDYVRLTSKSIMIPILSYLNKDFSDTRAIVEYVMSVRDVLELVLPFNKYSIRTLLAYSDQIIKEKPILYKVFDEYSILLDYVKWRLCMFPSSFEETLSIPEWYV